MGEVQAAECLWKGTALVTNAAKDWQKHLTNTKEQQAARRRDESYTEIHLGR